MNTKINLISNEIKSLIHIIDRLADKENFSQIEIDLALLKTQQVYDLLLQLEMNRKQTLLPSEKQASAEIINKKDSTSGHIPEPKSTPILKQESKVEEKPESKMPVVKEEDSTSIESDLILIEETPVNIENIEKNEVKNEVHSITNENDILAEKFKRSDPLINEVLARGGKRDFSSLMQSKPVKNIEAAIGINERFEFVRELFNGDAASYTKTIKMLDASSNFNEAFNYLNQTYSWDLESDMVHKLLDIVRRRFITEIE